MPRKKGSKNINASVPTYKGGIKTAAITTGTVDPIKAFQAHKAERHVAMTSTTGRAKTAGMMMDSLPSEGSFLGTSSLSGYQSSYAAGGNTQVGGLRDIPPYFIMMNEQNGGVLYWPVTLKEKYEWYRYFARTDAYCGRALELLSDLPMSKLSLNMPKMEGKPKELKKKIHGFFVGMCDRLGLFEKLQSILWEWNMIGNTFLFHEWDDKAKMWARIVMLPPEEVNIFQYPFSENARCEYRPERLINLVKMTEIAPAETLPDMHRTIIEEMPQELVKMIREQGCIIMDTDPSTGSFVHHIARRRSPYLDLGASVLERVLIPMLQKENYRYTQLGLATRNMTPKNKISAPGLTEDELGNLRMQIDLSYLDPDFSIVTNYDWQWDQIGANERLLDLQAEYEMIENHIFAGLGVTRELLTGEGTYSGNKITVEILNTVFLLTRELLQNYVEKQLFRPVCEAHGWYDTDEFGIKTYFYPKLGFNRLSIRDNQEVFDSLFQLYQKGSMPIDIIYELFNLNVDEIHERIYNDLFTVKDPVFNRILEETNVEIGRGLAEKTDIGDRVAKYLKLKMKSAEGEGGEGEMGGDMGDMGGEQPQEEQPLQEEQPQPQDGQQPQQQPQQPPEATIIPSGSPEIPEQVQPTEEPKSKEEHAEEIAQAISEKLDGNASEEEIQKEVDEAHSQKVNELADKVTEQLSPDASDEEIEKVVNQVLPEENKEEEEKPKEEPQEDEAE